MVSSEQTESWDQLANTWMFPPSSAARGKAALMGQTGDKAELNCQKTPVEWWVNEPLTFSPAFSYDRGSTFNVFVGKGQLIAGMDKALVGMCVNERRFVKIPPRLAYGSEGVCKCSGGPARSCLCQRFCGAGRKRSRRRERQKLEVVGFREVVLQQTHLASKVNSLFTPTLLSSTYRGLALLCCARSRQRPKQLYSAVSEATNTKSGAACLRDGFDYRFPALK